MATSVVVSLTLHGLIALVPVTVSGDGATLKSTGKNGANHIAALLVNAADRRSLQEKTACFDVHEPSLEFSIPDASHAACGPENGCELKELGPITKCSCNVTGRKIWLTPDYLPTARKFAPWSPAANELPSQGTTHHPDFSYFPNIANLGYHLDPAFLNGAPHALAARMTFPFDELIPCTFSVRPEDKDHDNVHSFSFQKLNDAYDQSLHKSEAMAQELMVMSKYAVSAEAPLELHLAALDGSRQVSFQLAQTGEVAIELKNERQHLSPDDPCNDGVGRDFGLSYQLVNDPGVAGDPDAWTKVPLPHLKTTKYVANRLVEDHQCDAATKGKGFMSRPICAMASFIE